MYRSSEYETLEIHTESEIDKKESIENLQERINELLKENFLSKSKSFWINKILEIEREAETLEYNEEVLDGLESLFNKLSEQYPEHKELYMEESKEITEKKQYETNHALLNIKDKLQNIENIREGLRILRHIEKIIEEYVTFIDDETTNTLLRTKYKWFSIEEISNIKNCFNKLTERIHSLINENNLQIQGQNSLIDILGNGPTIYMQYIKRLLAKDQKDENQIQDMTNQIYDIMNMIIFYINEIIQKDEKLHIALSIGEGYISSYSGYFLNQTINNTHKVTLYPGGSKKLKYFYFFLRCENGEISLEDIDEELSKLDDEFIDKELIKKDFPELKRS